MCRIMEDLYNEGRAEGRAEGRTEGRLNAMIESVRNLKEKLGFTDQQARDTLNISNEDWERIAMSV